MMLGFFDPENVELVIKAMELGSTAVVALGSIYLLLTKGFIPLRQKISSHTERVGELISKVVNLIEKQEENHARQLEQEKKNHKNTLNQIRESEKRIKQLIKKE